MERKQALKQNKMQLWAGFRISFVVRRHTHSTCVWVAWNTQTHILLHTHILAQTETCQRHRFTTFISYYNLLVCLQVMLDPEKWETDAKGNKNWVCECETWTAWFIVYICLNSHKTNEVHTELLSKPKHTALWAKKRQGLQDNGQNRHGWEKLIYVSVRNSISIQV